MKKKSITGFIPIIIFLIFAILFIIKFGGAQLLKLYINTGVGNCQQIPILCMAPREEISNPSINKEYILELTRFDFEKPKMEIFMPKNFMLQKGNVKEVYFKRLKTTRPNASMAFLLYRKPNFFINLFPQLTKSKIKNDYDFLSRTMAAKTNSINNITDTFFVIIKGIFTPNLGEMKNLAMIKFTSEGKRGFINYNLAPSVNYFDCNMLNAQGEYFKLYIKDTGSTLSLDKVFAIISTLNSDTNKAAKNH